MKKLFIFIISIILLVCILLAIIKTKKKQMILNQEAPVVIINLIEIPIQDIDHFIADWNESSKIIEQIPAFITSTLYRSLLIDSKYQIINVEQWQSYKAWFDINKTKQQILEKNIKINTGVYRPAAWSTNIYAESFSDSDKNTTSKKSALLKRAKIDPNIKSPDSPFVFINLMEMDIEDVNLFVADWKIRSKIMGQMPAAMASTLYRSTLPNNKFQIVNISQWQSYSGFIEANNDPFYAQELSLDLKNTPSIKLLRGFYRPIATFTQKFDTWCIF